MIDLIILVHIYLTNKNTCDSTRDVETYFSRSSPKIDDSEVLNKISKPVYS